MSKEPETVVNEARIQQLEKSLAYHRQELAQERREHGDLVERFNEVSHYVDGVEKELETAQSNLAAIHLLSSGDAALAALAEIHKLSKPEDCSELQVVGSEAAAVERRATLATNGVQNVNVAALDALESLASSGVRFKYVYPVEKILVTKRHQQLFDALQLPE